MNQVRSTSRHKCRSLAGCLSGGLTQRDSVDRSGLTVFEVLLSVAIFLGAMIALGELISSGRIAAQRGELQTEAVFRCETIVGQIASGVMPLDTALAGGGFTDDLEQRWSYSVLPIEASEADLLGFEVTVQHVNNVGAINYSFSLQRYMRDPQLYVDAAEAAADAEAEAASLGSSL